MECRPKKKQKCINYNYGTEVPTIPQRILLLSTTSENLSSNAQEQSTKHVKQANPVKHNQAIR